MLNNLRESLNNRVELWRVRSEAKTHMHKLEIKRAEIVSRLLEDQLKTQESWGKQSTDFELGWNQGINTMLRGGGDEKTPISLTTITDTMIPQSRRMFANNPFAQSAVRNLQHYVVGGDGFQYRKTGKNEAKVVEYWNEWMKRVGWRDIEMETLKRVIRDGECIIRWFDDVPRFVEPKQVIGTSDAPWGILTDPNDAVIPKVYYIAYVNPATGLIDASQIDKVPAAQVDHLKWPLVDLNGLRGVPPLYFVAANLDGAARCLKNMRELVAVQTAIAIVREHIEGVSGTDIVAWANAGADKEVTDGDTGLSVLQKKWTSGMMVDVPHGQKLHFPAATMRADSYIEVVQADLRAVAASMGLPEFIFTANASSSNYASLMAAEGPAVKAFETLQGWLGRFLARAYDRVINIGAGAKGAGRQRIMKDWGGIPARTATLPTSVIGPGVRTRDFFAEARTRLIEAQAGVLSPQEWCNSAARDYDETMSEIVTHRAAYPDMPWPPTLSAQQAQYVDQLSAGTNADTSGQTAQSKKTNVGSQNRDAGKSGA